MQRARRKKQASPYRPWRRQKRANTHAKARTSVRVRAAARRATPAVRPRTPVRVRAGAQLTEASRRQYGRKALESLKAGNTDGQKNRLEEAQRKYHSAHRR